MTLRDAYKAVVAVEHAYFRAKRTADLGLVAYAAEAWNTAIDGLRAAAEEAHVPSVASVTISADGEVIVCGADGTPIGDPQSNGSTTGG